MSSSSDNNSYSDIKPKGKDSFEDAFYDGDSGGNEEKRYGRRLDKDFDHKQDILHGSESFTKADSKVTYMSSAHFTLNKSSERKNDVQDSTPKTKEKVTIRLPATQSYADNDEDSSGSVTEVSPLSSPETTPRRDSNKKSKMNNGVTNIEKVKTADEDEDCWQVRKGNGEALSLEDLLHSSESNRESSDGRDFAEHLKKKRVHRKKKSRYDDVVFRTEESTRNHRRRMLDVAAQNSMDLSQLLEVVLEMEEDKKSRMSGSRDPDLPPSFRPVRRKNLSFSNNQVYNIDRENQRLLGRLGQLNSRQVRPSSASSLRSTSASSCKSTSRVRRPNTASSTRHPAFPGSRMYHSGKNRLRDQQRIERENLTFLRRLQQTKSSSHLRRDNLLREYEQKTGRSVAVEAAQVSWSQKQKRSELYDDHGDYNNVSLHQSRRKTRPVWQERW